MADPIVTASSSGTSTQTPTTPTTSADVANANALNQALSAVRQTISANNTAVLAKVNAIASAIPTSMVGGTTGTSANHLLISKGTTGFALQASSAITVDTPTGALQSSVANAGSSIEFFRVKPIDWTTGKPYMAMKTGASASEWQFILWDGTNSNGAINFIAQNLEYNGNIVATTNQLTTIVNPAVDIRTASATITIPPGATKLCIHLVGGGGGGGGCVDNSGGCTPANSVGGIGGPGGVLVKYLSGLTPGNTLALTIGAAGSAGAAGNNNGGNGGNSTLASGTQSITTLTASGGAGGQGGASGATGANGAAGGGTNGDLNWTGSAAGSFNTGLGFGYINNIRTATGNGFAGLGYGGPGTGGFNSALTGSNSGGAGTAGVAILNWYN